MTVAAFQRPWKTVPLVFWSIVCAVLLAWPSLVSARPPEDAELSPADDAASWWAFQPVNRPALPDVVEAERVANPIDRFVLARLEAAGMKMAPPAPPRILVRRVYLDLVGLPPTFDEVEEFCRQYQVDADGAYRELIEHLLGSHHYGERWARHWLDLVRFAETNGYERDATKPHAWRYRDYVVDAFNADMPYDRFVLEQLAGDELPDRNESTVIATGLMRLGTWDDEPNVAADYTFERLEDLVHTTSSAFLGLTVKCARCHDHKFDPIPQLDYYAFAGAFWAGYVAPGGGSVLGGPPKERLGFDVLGWTDRAREVPALHLLKNGEASKPLEPVPPGALTLVTGLPHRFAEAPPEANTSERRLQLARWIVDRRNPLTARVFVNRIWQHHFGRGIVRSSNNFGLKGAPPTHPQLLDWLASEFVARGWRLKALHRLILHSGTYRMASSHPKESEYAKRDADDLLLWKFRRQRLDAESLRDSMLTVSGDLNRRRGGPSFYPEISPEALEGLSRKGATWGSSSEEERRRRSLYIFSKRSLLVPFLTTFDLCDSTTSCAQRDVSIVAPQALALLNNHFAHARSRSLARRILAADAAERVHSSVDEAAAEASRQVVSAWQHVLARRPSASETRASLRHLLEQRRDYEGRHAEAVARFEAESRDRRELSGDAVVAMRPKLALWLRADAVDFADAGEGGETRVARWLDSGPAGHHAEVSSTAARPRWRATAIGGRPALQFDGDDAVTFRGPLITSREFTVFAVASDTSGEGGHREILSNWSHDGNSTSSVFLGLTGAGTVRFSDDFAAAGRIPRPHEPFVLTAVNASDGAAVYLGREAIARRSTPLAKRRLDRPFVVGTQGNYGSEFWRGSIAELIVFDRAVTDAEREAIVDYLIGRYDLRNEAFPALAGTPAELALASLCHVLLNTNEFIYVD